MDEFLFFANKFTVGLRNMKFSAVPHYSLIVRKVVWYKITMCRISLPPKPTLTINPFTTSDIHTLMAQTKKYDYSNVNCFRYGKPYKRTQYIK